MCWLALSLVAIAALAHHAFMAALNRQTGWESAVSDLALRVDALTGRLDRLAEAQNRTATASAQALADLLSRVRSCELKAGIRGIPSRGPDGNPPVIA